MTATAAVAEIEFGDADAAASKRGTGGSTRTGIAAEEEDATEEDNDDDDNDDDDEEDEVPTAFTTDAIRSEETGAAVAVEEFTLRAAEFGADIRPTTAFGAGEAGAGAIGTPISESASERSAAATDGASDSASASESVSYAGTAAAIEAVVTAATVVDDVAAVGNDGAVALCDRFAGTSRMAAASTSATKSLGDCTGVAKSRCGAGAGVATSIQRDTYVRHLTAASIDTQNATLTGGGGDGRRNDGFGGLRLCGTAVFVGQRRPRHRGRNDNR